MATALASGLPTQLLQQARKPFPSLAHLMNYVSQLTNTGLEKQKRRNLEFHSLQVSFDLVAAGLVDIADRCETCSTVGAAKGSRGGLQHVRRVRGDLSLSLEDVASGAKLSPICTQTALCDVRQIRALGDGSEPDAAIHSDQDGLGDTEAQRVWALKFAFL